MSVLYIALPIAIALGGLAMLACVASIRSGQFDDLESPPMRMLSEDRELERPAETSRSAALVKHHCP